MTSRRKTPPPPPKAKSKSPTLWIIVLLVGLALIALAFAFAPSAHSQPFVTNVPSSGVLVGPGGVPLPLPPSALTPPVTQNTIATTGPVQSETTISVGTLAGQVLQWLAAAFGVPIGGLLAAWLYRLFKLAGVQVADGLRSKLQEIIVNGINAGAKNATEQMQGKDQITIKNAVVQQAIAYTQAHGAETIKALGLDPQSGTTVEAIKARIETAINDPMTPTPAILDPINTPKAV
jgi:hypothetical protein